MPDKETFSYEIIFHLFLILCSLNTKMPIFKGIFKSFKYSRTENVFEKTGFDRNILSQPRPKMPKWSKKSAIVDDLK
jgi:hypothetical protein